MTGIKLLLLQNNIWYDLISENKWLIVNRIIWIR